MAKAISALGGRTAAGPLTVRDGGLRGMITLRGDLSDPKIRQAAEAVSGAAFPDQRKVTGAGENLIAWMSPDELLILVPHARAEAAIAELTDALSGVHHLAVNVSDARALITLEGSDLRDLLGKLAPVDLDPAAFAPGDFRRTRLGQVAAAFWFETDGLAHVVCFRSVAHYMFDQLAQAAADGAVGHY